MAAQRISGRFIRPALIGGPLLIACVVCAGTAHADEATYITHQHNIGIDFGDPALVHEGRIICEEVSSGANPRVMQSLILTDNQQQLSPRQADAIVDYALVDLCPRA